MENEIRSSLNTLTADNAFQVLNILIDEENFGNVIAELISEEHIKVQFIQDKGISWCSIGVSDEMYFLEDVLSLWEVAIGSTNQAFIPMVLEISESIKSEYPTIAAAFNKKNRKSTHRQLKKLERLRVIKY